ncbi:farnesyl-diphosphate farnesyltransferase [Gigaspora margarita]|uniref:squalene synthase n=1 Tax=Gigaspora margarita TaxID=4874 RepID=A0A8H4EHK2_GIGMA|nr:farnesyl-diphosphate farnesyltransferase [Gigaspora margarita]
MLSNFVESIFYPSELIALVRYQLFRQSTIVDISTWSKTKQRCYYFLKMTSGSFAAIIMDLDPKLRDLVCIFYLCLRGMDTIEDDMTLPTEKKAPLLRSFYKNINQKGWTFTENGPDEKDRQLLVEFDVVIEEFLLLPEECQAIIINITKQMGNGMADFVSISTRDKYNIITLKDFDKYCYYVAGLVGIGISDLFNSVGATIPDTTKNLDIIISMGIFLQKLNILRDFVEDLNENRRFWPKEIWYQYVSEIEELILVENKEKALNCLSALVLNTLLHVPDCLNYLILLDDPDIFSFAATPLVMGYSTLASTFKNYDSYSKVIKIRKGEGAKLFFRCTNSNYSTSLYNYRESQAIFIFIPNGSFSRISSQ